MINASEQCTTKSFLVKDKNFYKNFFSICIVLVLQNMLTLSVNLADNVMLGAYSEASLGGATACNQIQFVYQQLLLGICEGLVIFASQFWGKGDTNSIKKVGSIATRFGIGIMVTLFILATIMPRQLVMIFTESEDMIAEGVKYLSIIKFSYIPFCLTYITLAVLKSTETVKIAFWLSVSTLILNCGINYILIYGRFGMPELGIRGAAIGTLTARIVEFVILIAFIKLKECKLNIKLGDYKSFDKELCVKYLIRSVPVLIASALWGVNTAAQTAILGHMQDNAITANSAASNLFLLVKTAAVSAAGATSVIIGKTIGSGQLDKIKQYSNTFQVLFVVMGLICAVVLYLLIEPVLSLYKISAESKEIARSFMVVLSFATFFMAYQMPSSSGLIRGAGETKYTMWLNIYVTYLISLPLAYIMAFVFNAPPVIVVVCLNMDQMLKCFPCFFKVNKGDWVHKLV